jgi:hypothetical protein
LHRVTEMKLDLNEVRLPKDSKFLSGRPSGEAARKHFKLDNLDVIPEKVEVDIPQDLYGVNISFFLGMFGPSIRKRGTQYFRDHYLFNGPEVHNRIIEEGIRRALADATIFSAT